MVIEMKNKKDETKKEIGQEIVDKYNKLYNADIKSVSEVLDILSDEFAEKYSMLLDGQAAYDELYDEHKELMKGYCFVYSLTGGDGWRLEVGSGYDSNNDGEYIREAKEVYSYDKIEDIDDVLDAIIRDIDRTMCNGGCDMFTAFNMILEEDFSSCIGKSVFRISCDEVEPVIELLDLND